MPEASRPAIVQSDLHDVEKFTQEFLKRLQFGQGVALADPSDPGLSSPARWCESGSRSGEDGVGYMLDLRVEAAGDTIEVPAGF